MRAKDGHVLERWTSVSNTAKDGKTGIGSATEYNMGVKGRGARKRLTLSHVPRGMPKIEV
jgi:hypothetical protein